MMHFRWGLKEEVGQAMWLYGKIGTLRPDSENRGAISIEGAMRSEEWMLHLWEPKFRDCTWQLNRGYETSDREWGNQLRL